ncbi:hypothetical protein U1Q18_005046 [Sarracenia purpurea var. burkii]
MTMATPCNDGEAWCCVGAGILHVGDEVWQNWVSCIRLVRGGRQLVRRRGDEKWGGGLQWAALCVRWATLSSVHAMGDAACRDRWHSGGAGHWTCMGGAREAQGTTHRGVMQYWSGGDAQWW